MTRDRMVYEKAFSAGWADELDGVVADAECRTGLAMNPETFRDETKVGDATLFGGAA